MIINKFVLGTAQFGMPYGLTKREIPLGEIKKILDYSKRVGIRTLDTAPSYNNSLKKLGHLNMNEWKIISKIPSIPKNIKNKKKWVEQVFFDTLKKLNISKIDTILLHDEEDILNKKYGEEIFKILDNLKSNKLVKNIGSSIYNSQKIKDVINRYNFDIIQAPYNIFDKRIISTGLYSLLNKRNIKLDLRSIFLQGLLLRQKNYPKKFKNNKYLNQFNNWLSLKKHNNINVCLSMTSKIKFHRLVIGFHSLSQLKEIVKYSSSKIISIPDFDINNKNLLIDPRKW